MIIIPKEDNNMHATRKVTNDILYIGADDRRLQLFENMFPIPDGVSYNAYLITDEKTALIDTADASVRDQFMENLAFGLNGRKLDYFIINHMEPDHCALIAEIAFRYPDVTLVANTKIFTMIDQFFGLQLPAERKLVVKEGDTLSLGKHQLSFVFAPMVHWPEVMMTYDATDKVLFCADAFGTFGTVNGNIFNDEIDYKDGYFVSEARRYYTNIVGKYGMQVQAALKKASTVDIAMLAPLHGPIWRTDLGFIIDLYTHWATYTAEDKAVAVFYSSIYGNTKSAVAALAMALGDRGVKNVKIYDVSKTDISYMIAEAFRVSTIVLAATTYNNGIFPKMHYLLDDMKALCVQNKKVAIIENGSWAPQSGKLMQGIVSEMKNMELIGDKVTIKSSLADATSLYALADAIAETVKG